MARPWSSLDVDRMRQLYAAGPIVEQVTAELGINPTTVSRRLRAAGVMMRPVGAPSPLY